MGARKPGIHLGLPHEAESARCQGSSDDRVKTIGVMVPSSSYEDAKPVR